MEVLQIVALSSLAALVTEAAMYLWAFRRDSFRTLRVRPAPWGTSPGSWAPVPRGGAQSTLCASANRPT